MKIKRKEYERLIERSQTLADLEHTTIIVRTRTFVNDGKPEPIGPGNLARIITPEILRENLVNYVKANAIEEWESITPAKPWIAGPIQIEFVRMYSGYEYANMNRYGGWFTFRETIAPTSPGTSETAPDYETGTPTDAATMPASQEEETTTENGKTDGASPPNASHVSHVIPVRECPQCYYPDGRLKGFTYYA